MYVRRAANEDIAGIKKLISNDLFDCKKRFGNFSIEDIIEKSNVSLVCMDKEELVGFVSFEAYSFKKIDLPEKQFNLQNSFWVSFFYVKDDTFEESTEELFLTLFTTFPSIDHVFYSLYSEDVPLFNLLTDYDFVSVSNQPNLYHLNRREVASKLDIRIARVEDFDDIKPLLKLPNLTLFNVEGERFKMSEKERRQRAEVCFLSDLLHDINEDRKIIVAMDEESKIVGVMYITREVTKDIERVKRSYDMSEFKNIIENVQNVLNDSGSPIENTGDEDGELEEEIGEDLQPIMQRGKKEDGEDGKRRVSEAFSEESVDLGLSQDDLLWEGKPGKEGEGEGGEEEEGESDEEREEEEEEVQGIEEYEELNAFEIKMFHIRPEYKDRSLDMLNVAFSLFPEKKYCCVFMCYKETSHSLLDHFVLARAADRYDSGEEDGLLNNDAQDSTGLGGAYHRYGRGGLSDEEYYLQRDRLKNINEALFVCSKDSFYDSLTLSLQPEEEEGDEDDDSFRLRSQKFLETELNPLVEKELEEYERAKEDFNKKKKMRKSDSLFPFHRNMHIESEDGISRGILRENLMSMSDLDDEDSEEGEDSEGSFEITGFYHRLKHELVSFHDEFYMNSENGEGRNSFFEGRNVEMVFLRAKHCEAEREKEEELMGFSIISYFDKESKNSEGTLLKLQEKYDFEEYLKQIHCYQNSETIFLHTLLIRKEYQNHSQFFLREIMMMMGKRICFFDPNQRSTSNTLLNKDMIPLLPRRRIEKIEEGEEEESKRKITIEEEDGEDGENDIGVVEEMTEKQKKFLTPYYPFYFLTMKHSSNPKIRLCDRVVVVGASKTSLSFIQTCLSIPYLYFNEIVLISPDGLSMYMRHSHSFFAEDGTNYQNYRLLTSLHLPNLTVVEDKLLRINKANKEVYCDSDLIIPYDYLILATSRAYKFSFDSLDEDQQQSQDNPDGGDGQGLGMGGLGGGMSINRSGTHMSALSDAGSGIDGSGSGRLSRSSSAQNIADQISPGVNGEGGSRVIPRYGVFNLPVENRNYERVNQYIQKVVLENREDDLYSTVVYGSTLDAFVTAQAMLDEFHLRSNQVVLVCPKGLLSVFDYDENIRLKLGKIMSNLGVKNYNLFSVDRFEGREISKGGDGVVKKKHVQFVGINDNDNLEDVEEDRERELFLKKQAQISKEHDERVKKKIEDDLKKQKGEKDSEEEEDGEKKNEEEGGEDFKEKEEDGEKPKIDEVVSIQVSEEKPEEDESGEGEKKKESKEEETKGDEGSPTPEDIEEEDESDDEEEEEEEEEGEGEEMEEQYPFGGGSDADLGGLEMEGFRSNYLGLEFDETEQEGTKGWVYSQLSRVKIHNKPELDMMKNRTQRAKRKKSQVLPCHLFINCEKKDVDMRMLNTFKNNQLVFDGRLIVDPEFRTTSPSIYAAGPLAKFSRTHGIAEPMEISNSYEIGQKMAYCILRTIGIEEFYNERIVPDLSKVTRIPQFTKRVTQKAYILGGYHYLKITLIKEHLGGMPSVNLDKESKKISDGDDSDNEDSEEEDADLSDEEERKRRKVAREERKRNIRLTDELINKECEKLVTDHQNPDRYTAIYVHRKNGMIMKITYFGKSKVEENNLHQLVGLSSGYCNELVQRYKEGLVKDFIPFLSQSSGWSKALYCDTFRKFRKRIFSSPASGSGKEKSAQLDRKKQEIMKIAEELRKLKNYGEVKKYLKENAGKSRELSSIHYVVEKELLKFIHKNQKKINTIEEKSYFVPLKMREML